MQLDVAAIELAALRGRSDIDVVGKVDFAAPQRHGNSEPIVTPWFSIVTDKGLISVARCAIEFGIALEDAAMIRVTAVRVIDVDGSALNVVVGGVINEVELSLERWILCIPRPSIEAEVDSSGWRSLIGVRWFEESSARHEIEAFR